MQWRIKSTASSLFTQPFIQAQIKGNIKAPRHWPLCGEFTGDTEKVSIWWRHHEISALLALCEGNYRSSVDFLIRRPLMRSFHVSFVLAWTSCWTNSRIIGDLTHHYPYVTSLWLWRRAILLRKYTTVPQWPCPNNTNTQRTMFAWGRPRPRAVDDLIFFFTRDICTIFTMGQRKKVTAVTFFRCPTVNISCCYLGRL